MKPWQSIVLGVLLGCGLMAAIFIIARQPQGTPFNIKPAPTQGLIAVYITGCVKTPGLFELPPNSRLQDAVQKAGGASDCANLEVINLAQIIQDGQKINIPSTSTGLDSIGKSEIITDESPAQTGAIALVDINNAGIVDLMSLPGIGETRAQSIIDYRNENGPFIRVEDVLDVPGIGEKTYDQIKDYITITP